MPADGRDKEDLAARARTILRDLEKEIVERYPAWSQRGPEDPGWVLLELFAEALARVSADVDRLRGSLAEHALDLLGEGARWASPAEGAVVFVPRENAQEAVAVPVGTEILAERGAGEPPLVFRTVSSAWCSPHRLLRVATVSEAGIVEIFPYPQGGWDRGATALFGGWSRIPRYLYLGDPILGLLRDRSGNLALEWPGIPAALVDGAWEVSVRGGWRAVRPRAEIVRGAMGRPSLRLSVEGPIPDLAESLVGRSSSVWLRLLLPADRRIVLPQPVWSAAELEGKAVSTADLGAVAGAGVFPRPVLRVFTRHGERWQDHSLSGAKIQAVDAPSATDPAIYLGWERPTAGSLYWQLDGRAVPEGWAQRDEARFPRIAWEYSSGRTFRPLEVEDSTASFTRSGVTAWSLPAEWTPQEHLGERLFWIRARWVGGSYRKSPALRAVLPNAAAVRQEVVRESEVFETRVSSYGRAELPLCLASGYPEAPAEIDVRRRGGEWSRLAGNFSVVRAPSAGYVLCLEPNWQGDIEVRFPDLRITFGAAGNLPPGRLTRLARETATVGGVLQPLPLSGGRDPEEPVSYRRRILAEWRTGDRVVTPADYRRHCLALDPEIARVEVSVSPDDPARVSLWIVPGEPHVPGRFPPERLRWLEESLEEKAPLGVMVEAHEAAYVPIEIRARQVAPGPVPGEATRKQLEERLRKFLHPLWGGWDGKGFPAGKWIEGADVAAALGAAALRTGDREAQAALVSGGGQFRFGDWDPRIWRFEIAIAGGEGEPGGSERPAQYYLTIPVLERLTFELE